MQIAISAHKLDIKKRANSFNDLTCEHFKEKIGKQHNLIKRTHAFNSCAFMRFALSNYKYSYFAYILKELHLGQN